jgi:hypothetical protein
MTLIGFKIGLFREILHGAASVLSNENAYYFAVYYCCYYCVTKQYCCKFVLKVVGRELSLEGSKGCVRRYRGGGWLLQRI